MEHVKHLYIIIKCWSIVNKPNTYTLLYNISRKSLSYQHIHLHHHALQNPYRIHNDILPDNLSTVRYRRDLD